MPRPKKTTPTIIDPVTTYDITPAKMVSAVATTEPDTTLNPDRAQVAAVADLPHAHEPVVVDTPPPTLESVLAAKDATIAEQSARIAELEAELVRVALESLTPAPARPLTAADHAAGYLAITSGKVRAAKWRGNILHDIRDRDQIVGQVAQMGGEWAPSVSLGTRNVAMAPMKEQADARAWVERQCGCVVVA